MDEKPLCMGTWMLLFCFLVLFFFSFLYCLIKDKINNNNQCYQFSVGKCKMTNPKRDDDSLETRTLKDNVMLAVWRSRA